MTITINKDEIIRMALEAGLICESRPVTAWIESTDLTPYLINFAALVAAHEREKTKAVFEELEREVKAELINAINGAVADEREACAKVCEEFGWYGEDPAAAIRARGETK